MSSLRAGSVQSAELGASTRPAGPTGSGGRVVVVGGGPAGLAVAIQARLAGLPVTVLDRARPPIDKPCGEGLMPDGVARLRDLGVELPATARPFRGIRYLDEVTVAEGFFPRPEAAAEAEDERPAGEPVPAGLGLRRTELHAAMVRRAEALGAELRWGERVDRVLTPKERSGDGPAEAAPGAEAPVGVVTAAGDRVEGCWLVGADGLLSRVRRHVAGSDGSETARSREPAGAARRFGIRRHLRITPWTDLVEVHWAAGAEAYVTPVGPETVGVAMLWSPEQGAGQQGSKDSAGRASPPGSPGRTRFDDLLALFPRLAERVAGAAQASRGLDRDRGCGPLAQRVAAVARGRVALAGDAGGYLDAITGEGLSLAFHQAEALVRTIVACEEAGTADLRPYARAYRRICRLPERLIRLLLFVERHPALRRRVLAALAADPALFDRILGVHARILPPRSLVAGGGRASGDERTPGRKGPGGLLRFAGHLLRPPRPPRPSRR